MTNLCLQGGGDGGHPLTVHVPCYWPRSGFVISQASPRQNRSESTPMAFAQVSIRPFTFAFVRLEIGVTKSDNFKHARETLLKAAASQADHKDRI